MASSSWIERLARFGYACKGIVYLIFGLLAASASLGRGGDAGDKNDALWFIRRLPFGHALLIAIALGLAGYAAYRLLSGVADKEHRGDGAKGLAMRAGSIVRGLFYATIAWEVCRAGLRKGGLEESSDEAARHWTARAMDAPFGRWLVAIGGLCIIGYGLYQLYSAVAAKLSKRLDLSSASARSRRVMIGLSRFGLGARGIVFGVVGVSLVRAAMRHSASAAHGTSGALRDISHQPFGGSLLTLIGLGLAAYGVYAMINARYRRIEG